MHLLLCWHVMVYDGDWSVPAEKRGEREVCWLLVVGIICLWKITTITSHEEPLVADRIPEEDFC